MKQIVLIASLLLSLYIEDLRAEEAISKKFVAFEVFTLPQSLVDQNTLFIQHSMDIVMGDSQFDLLIGKVKKDSDTIKVAIVVIETKDHFYGEVRTYDPAKKKFIGVVPFDFKRKEEAIEPVRIAFTEALLGKQYVLEHKAEIKEKSKIKFTSSSKARPVNLTSKETKLLANKFEINQKDILVPITKESIGLQIPQAPRPDDKEKALEQNNLKIESTTKTETANPLPKPITTPSASQNSKILSTAGSKESKEKEDDTPKINTKLIFDAFVYSGQLQIVTEKNIKITTTIGHVGAGIRVRQIQLNVDRPWIYMGELQIAKPLKSDNFSIPMWRKLEAAAQKKTTLKFLSIGAGLEFEPLYFIALPVYGEGLTVVDNSIFWSYLYSQLYLPDYGDKYSLSIKVSKSIFTTSSTDTKLAGVKLNFILHSQLSERYAFDVNFQRSFLHDEENEASNQILSGFIRYQF